MKHIQPIITCAGAARKPARMPAQAWTRLAIGAVAFATAATLALALIQ